MLVKLTDLVIWNISEMEQGKAKGEGEQHGAFRSGHLRQAPI